VLAHLGDLEPLVGVVLQHGQDLGA
jgi:hypothetical protein